MLPAIAKMAKRSEYPTIFKVDSLAALASLPLDFLAALLGGRPFAEEELVLGDLEAEAALLSFLGRTVSGEVAIFYCC